MPATKDPYSVLGVDRKATAEEIKKAYRKLARQYHPDRNSGDARAEARFKEINEANDILSDPEKRAAFDRGDGLFGAFGAGGRGGTSPFTGGGFDGGSFSDILSNLFGGAGGAGGGRRSARPQPARGRDLEASLQISFDQAISGGQVPLAVPTAVTCATCHGTGAKPGTKPSVCPVCGGRGIEGLAGRERAPALGDPQSLGRLSGFVRACSEAVAKRSQQLDFGSRRHLGEEADNQVGISAQFGK